MTGLIIYTPLNAFVKWTFPLNDSHNKTPYLSFQTVDSKHPILIDLSILTRDMQCYTVH